MKNAHAAKLIEMARPASLRSRLQRKMTAAFMESKDNVEGAAFVIYAPSGTGKTHAAATL